MAALLLALLLALFLPQAPEPPAPPPTASVPAPAPQEPPPSPSEAPEPPAPAPQEPDTPSPAPSDDPPAPSELSESPTPPASPTPSESPAPPAPSEQQARSSSDEAALADAAPSVKEAAQPFRQRRWWREAAEAEQGAQATSTTTSGPRSPRIALVMDDLGLSQTTVRRALALPPEVTLSFLAYAPGLDALLARAAETGHRTLIHLPMQPQGPHDPGPDSLRVDDPPEVRARLLRQTLSRAGSPDEAGYAGVNNHMGSLATENEPLMRGLLEELRREGLLFFDSRTTARSVGPRLAEELGLAFAERDVFVDHTAEAEPIRARLAEAEAIAARKGYVVAIAHPHEATLNILEQWLPGLEARGYRLVPLPALIHEAGGYLPRASDLPTGSYGP